LYGELEDIISIINITESDMTFECYPNPFHSSFTLEVDGIYTYEIFNLQGKVLETGVGNSTVELGAKLDEGVYFLKLSKGDNIKVLKIVKQ
jgi:hypothetical protein